MVRSRPYRLATVVLGASLLASPVFAGTQPAPSPRSADPVVTERATRCLASVPAADRVAIDSLLVAIAAGAPAGSESVAMCGAKVQVPGFGEAADIPCDHQHKQEAVSKAHVDALMNSESACPAMCPAVGIKRDKKPDCDCIDDPTHHYACSVLDTFVCQ